MELKSSVQAKIKELFPSARSVGSRPPLIAIGATKLNLRTASEKAGEKFWFDVTPSFLTNGTVQFFVYACGSSDHLYVFPAAELARFVADASLGGQKQVPNFTIYRDSNELEPAGKSENRFDVRKYRNNFDQIPATKR